MEQIFLVLNVTRDVRICNDFLEISRSTRVRLALFSVSFLYVACNMKLVLIKCHLSVVKSGRWQAPAAVLPPEGWQRGRGPEGPEDKGHGHSRAREWPKHASPRARSRVGNYISKFFIDIKYNFFHFIDIIYRYKI